ncbi:uncharacterized protein B0H18DRAFT_1019106 [Fomitopsis serialis]|uniref:uncharacterized protein n=1 Tax=Fomitopsis serialis TaxID=139415 RepID=UPI002008D04D|nr:uncharacterized protein B0H18DRAFT_1019106 [Neoantrodia serialis]KAH9922101.1 hypothetical protein B0H18DRAFT_1019106 [Neoantrodia serialis]
MKSAPAQARNRAALVRDEELWFSDGNLMLEANGHVFRIYQGLLAQNSEVFRDLFTTPRSTYVETFEGCRVFHLTDRPEDLRHLLRVVYHGNRYYRPDEQLDFATVAALVRLSHKYQIDHIRDTYLSRMKSCFCTEFETWVTVSRDGGSPVMKFGTADAISAVDIAHLTGAESMLPTALYSCCQLKAEHLISGCPRPDGTVEYLSPVDTMKCVDARQTLYQKAITTGLEIFSPLAPSPLCLDRVQCGRAIQALRGRHLRFPPADVIATTLSPKHLMFSSLPTEERLYVCPECADLIREAEEPTYRKIWAELPRLLGIETPSDWPTA